MRLSTLINLTLSIGLPLGLAILLIIKDRKRTKPLMLGVITFLIFQVFTRIPLLQLVLANQVWYILFSYDQPILYLFLLSLSAGLFEEIGRFLIMKRWLKNGSFMDVFSFGIGHGGIEAILLVGLGVLLSDVSSVDDFSMIMGGIERIFALCMHVAFSFMVYAQVSKHQRFGLAVSILAHTLVNFIAVYLMSLGLGILIVELSLFIMSILAVVYVLRERKRFNESTISTT